MSASEKLKALGREVATKELGKRGVGELIDALPQIVAVVEAAERSKVWLFNSPLEGSLDRYQETADALYALNDALPGGDADA